MTIKQGSRCVACVTGHSFVHSMWYKAVIVEVNCSHTQQQTAWQSSQLCDPFTWEARQKCAGISKRTGNTTNCNSVMLAFFIALCLTIIHYHLLMLWCSCCY